MLGFWLRVQEPFFRQRDLIMTSFPTTGTSQMALKKAWLKSRHPFLCEHLYHSRLLVKVTLIGIGRIGMQQVNQGRGLGRKFAVSSLNTLNQSGKDTFIFQPSPHAVKL